MTKQCRTTLPCNLNSCVTCLQRQLNKTSSDLVLAESERDYWKQSATNAERSYISAIHDAVAYRAVLDTCSSPASVSDPAAIQRNVERASEVLRNTRSGADVLAVVKAARLAMTYNRWKKSPVRAMPQTTINALIKALKQSPI
jgi:hypothetical protein